MSEGEWPDCSEKCANDAEDWPCEGCPLESEEYVGLIEAVSDPLYRVASEFLTDHELGLDRFWDEPDFVTIQAIRFVSSERYRQAEDRRKYLKDGQG